MIEWLQRKALVIMGVVIAALFITSAVQTVRLKSAKASLVKVQGELKNAKANLDASETLRKSEQLQDRGSFAATTERCEQRIITARDSAAVIKGIVNAPNVNPIVRPIVGADQLRRIIGQGAGGAAVVSVGSDGAKGK